jgi:uroporphyrinogen-III synthase
VQNFAALQGKANSGLDKIRIASIEPVTSSTLRELGWRADVAAKEFTIPGLVAAIRRTLAARVDS